MIFNFGDTQIKCQVIEKSTFSSQHSGRLLRSLSIQIVRDGKDLHEHFLSLIRNTKEIDSLDELTSALSHWKIESYSYSHTDGSAIYYHTIKVKEFELFQVTSLEVGELRLSPYFYKEFFDGDSLQIEAKVILDGEKQDVIQKLIQNNDEITVIRHGIDEQPRLMTLNHSYWSKDGSQVKHGINLADVNHKNKSPKSFDYFEYLGSMVVKTMINQATIDVLLTTLVTKGIFSDAEIAKMNEDIREKARNNYYDSFQVTDIDTN
ncbi:hypothetical protein PCC8801_0613 [Rippkaea orientalis PCC 8801]|uniref:Uncharacterized protein n=1 Tax=Rippkaea orientalis (strain PCC 8801 / RF-1) TaxID=41431 RepID=B7JWQ5_RIPO1|nr:hypothetical protein [Rippkaea orientalis]ACK64701.1 hypothetical protein PCC8801_0613 [Rippkaea orientalis PCC 8801]